MIAKSKKFSTIILEEFKIKLTKDFEVETSIIEELIGNQFNTLNNNLQKFHGKSARRNFRGNFKFSRGKFPLFNKILDFLNFPKEGEISNGFLIVKNHNDKEYWYRKLGNWKFKSVLDENQGFLRERFGHISLKFSIKIIDERIYYIHIGTWLSIFRLPPRLSPKLYSSETPAKNGFIIDVKLISSVIGKVFQYRGLIKID